MPNGVHQYIKESAQAALNNRTEYSLFGDISVYIKDPITNNINIGRVLKQVEETVPAFLAQGVESVFVGQFEELKEREVDAVFLNGTIYVTNEQDSEEDMFDDVVHEFAHSVEEWAGMEIYGDSTLKYEFLAKREILFKQLSQIGYGNLHLRDFLDTEYSKNFDFFLYKSVGYDKLDIITVGLFPTPYSATSIREYFAIGFEEYLFGDSRQLKEISPALYSKIEQLINFV
jgi:hypothetical protein